MTRVLQIITVPLAFDGISLFVRRYAAHMDKTDLKMDFLAINDVDAAVAEEIAGMGCGLHVIKGRMRNPARYAARLARLARREKYDVVHVHGNSCTLAIDLLGAFLGGVKVRAAHSHNTFCRFTTAHRLLRPLFDALYTHAFACGEEAGKWLFHRRPFEIIPIAVDIEKYAFDPAAREMFRRELGVNDDILIGAAANFNPQKNHAFMLEAFAEYLKRAPKAYLALAGDGALRGDMEAAAARLGIKERVMFLGRRADVPGLMQAFDALLLPSLHEGFPTVLMECQAAGLRAFVSDRVTRSAAVTPLVKYLPIDRGSGIWAEALAELDAPGDRTKASAEGAAALRLRGYDIDESAGKLRAWYAACGGR